MRLPCSEDSREVPCLEETTEAHGAAESTKAPRQPPLTLDVNNITMMITLEVVEPVEAGAEARSKILEVVQVANLTEMRSVI